MDQIKKRTGIDLRQYKEAQMKRRLTALRDKKGYPTYEQFFKAMTTDSALFDEFLDRMTINVSEFFRNRSRWEVLENKIIPKLLEGKKNLKVWSAACSTGEEPYSLVMSLAKHLPLNQIQVLATDIDQQIIARAKEGKYVERQVKEVPKDILNTHFTKEGITYFISPEIKKHVTFQHQNLLADPFDSNFDLIVCRNVMIYFTDEAKNELYHKFSKALRPGGILFVGSTEQIFNPQLYNFETEDTFFYKKKA